MDPAHGLLGLHHIGIAVRSIAEALPRWTDGLGLRLHSVDVVPTEKVRVAVLMAGTTRIELIEPTEPDSPVGRYLDKYGPGVHHLAFHTADGQRHIDALKAAGAQMIHHTPQPGAHDCKIAFVHPKYLGGVLAELVEDPHHA
jgi:methylmalonyl-CoA epimerase